METKFNFTDNRLRTLRHDGTNKRIIFYDKTQSGLALQLTPTGTKTFQIRTWDNRTKKPVAYSGEVGHAFQSKPAGHSGGSRPPVPVIPATLVGA